MNNSAVVLSRCSSPCAANRCGSLASFVEGSRLFEQVHEENGSFSGTIPFVPDVIVLRFSGEHDAEDVIASCRRKWNTASILAFLCRRWRASLTDAASLLNRVDDFIACPFRETEFLLRVQQLLRAHRTSLSACKQQVQQQLGELSLIGESPRFLRVVDKIPALARADQTVLISGATGTGKEIIARAIHYRSRRRFKTFVPVNCGALPDHLVENEIFGHVKGAFTDASSAEKGLIAEAEGGTLFLDEIDGLSLAAQAKLLRFLENREYRPLGCSRTNIADVRVIAATNADLMERIKGRAFRQDLYYRLNTLSVFVPPLRERMDDLVPLVEHFVAQYAKQYREEPRGVSKAVYEKLKTYSWPGNIRELQSVIQRALVLAVGPTLQSEDIDLPSDDFEQRPAGIPPPAMRGTIEKFERDYLIKLMAAHDGNVTHAARAAGKERRTLQRLLRKHSLDRRAFRPPTQTLESWNSGTLSGLLSA